MPHSVLPIFLCSSNMSMDVLNARVSPDAEPSTTGETTVATSRDLLPIPAETGTSCDPVLVQAVKDAPEATHALIRFIQRRYHDSQLDDLEELLRLAQEVDGHRGNGSRASHGIVVLLSKARARLTAQMHQDKSFLFPMMLSGARPQMTLLIKRVMAEHQSQLDLIEQLQDVVETSRVPAAAHAPWRALSFGIKEFAEDLRAHVHLKNAVLFPRFL